MRHPILLIPGLSNSGPGHWQSLWEASLSNISRVQMPNWDFPHRPHWVEALDGAIRKANEEAPPILVAHSLGCITVAHWAAANLRPVHAALLVAPSDVERFPDQFPSFIPIPLRILPFRTRVVASSDDPFVTLDRAQAFADAWGSQFTDLGPRGHINTASGFGPWARGEGFLEELG